MSKVTELATGQITGADILTIELVEPSDTPPVIRLLWPTQPSITQPHRLGATANAVMSVLAAAIAKLATTQADDGF